MTKTIMLPKDGTPVVIGNVSGTSPYIIILYEYEATGQSAILVSVGTSISKLIGEYFAENNSTLKCYISSDKKITIEMNYSMAGRLKYKIIGL